MREQSYVARPVPIENLGDAKLVRLLAYWNALRGERRMPQRDDLLPEDMAEMLGRLALVEIDADKQRFRFRLVGTRLVAVFGRDCSGEYLDALEPPAFRALWKDLFRTVFASQAPLCQEIQTRRERQNFAFRALVLPLAGEGNVAQMLLIGCNWGSGEVPLFEPLRPQLP